jgi:HEAT repeat protein
MKPEETVPNSGRKLFFGLFVFPLLIAVGMAVLLCSVVLLTNEKETPETLIMAIKTGSPGKRWQKAFELSNELNKKTSSFGKDSLLKEIIHIFQDPVHYDSKTRAYMAIALSHFDDPRAVDVLTKALKNNDADIQIYALWALGSLQAKTSVEDCLPFLKSDNSELRKISAYVLGALGDRKTSVSLKPLLNDPVSDVRWNAALSLARLGDDSASEVLFKMLDRKSLILENNLSDEAAETIMVNAVKGLTLIGKADSIKILQELSRNDKSLKVRQVAIQSLELLSRKTN